MDQGSDEFSSETRASAVDFAFLAEQTFGDSDLERDVLRLFMAQSRRITSGLAGLNPRAQADAVHLLKGSAQGIGAWEAARMAERYEVAHVDARPAILPPLIETFAAAVDAIEAHLVAVASSGQ